MKITIGKVTLLMYFLLKLQYSIKRKKKYEPVDNLDSETRTALGGGGNDQDPLSMVPIPYKHRVGRH